MLCRLGAYKSHDLAIEGCRHLSRSVNIREESMTNSMLADLLDRGSPGQQLAILETLHSVPKDDPWVERYQSLLVEAATVYPQNVDAIAEMTMTHAELRKVGKEPFPDQILGGAIDWRRSRDPKLTNRISYADFLKPYTELTLNTNMRHRSIITQMKRSPEASRPERFE